ncbi:MAG: hotdog fold thioesterase [Syntrophomonadaceae bacterium]|jgi:uncharacterized protein (TIGR00369 family)|nr:hotdog fold thioesterase [Syntrophomonadaceae bacterium]MDH7497253.1 hotdog fold thioesterase [Syntrophomonadaceae bacterium]
MKWDWSGTIMDTLGIELLEYSRERVVATMPVDGRHHQPFGYMHGGASVVLAETVASAGSYQFIDPTRQAAVGVEINANHLRSTRSGPVRATGIPLHVGRRFLVWDVRIEDGEGRLVCVSRCTIGVTDSVQAPKQPGTDLGPA